MTSVIDPMVPDKFSFKISSALKITAVVEKPHYLQNVNQKV